MIAYIYVGFYQKGAMGDMDADVYLRSQHLWCVSITADDPQTPSVGNSGSELRAGRDVHSCDHVIAKRVKESTIYIPARMMGCLIPKSSVTGVVMTDMVTSRMVVK